MKRFVTLILFSLILVAGVHAEKLAVLTKVRGDVMLQRASDLDYAPGASAGTILEENDQIKVGEGFAVLLLLDNKSQVKLRSNTEIAINMDEDLSGSRLHVRLDYGQALTKYDKDAGFEFQLHTPTSVASIKGTEFWTISDPNTGDQIIVLEGMVDVMNNLTGMITTGLPGQTVNSGTDGYIESVPTPPESIPEDPEDDFGAGPEQEAEEEEQVAEEAPAEEADTEAAVDFLAETPAPTIAPTPDVDIPEEEPVAEEEGGGLFGEALAMDAGFGAVTIDGELYNQIALRPDISIGKLGVGLDLVIYMNQDGDIRSDEWNEAKDILDKIMYVRWGQPGDPLYVRVGTLENVVLGYGLFMNGYSNMMEYPSIRKTGHHIGFTVAGIGFESVIANYKEFTSDMDFGLMGLRATYSLGKLKFGMTAVMDNNQYLGLKDTDGDGRPDLVDDFPEDEDSWLDTDGDGYADDDPLEYDIDGDNMTDNHPNPIYNFDDDGVERKPEPFNVHDDPRGIGALSVDVGYPLVNKSWLDLVVYSEAGQYVGRKEDRYVYFDNNGLDSTAIDYGFGLVAPGIRANIFKIVTASLEFRMTSGNFIFGLFDRNYDIERVSFVDLPTKGLTPVTRYEKLFDTPELMGVFGSVGVNLMDWVTISGGYQDMRSGDTEVKGIQGYIGLAPDLIPKVKDATAYIIRMNVDDPWDIVSEGTLMGYKVTVGLGGGATLTWDFRQTYRDLNGDMEIDTSPGSGEVVATTSIETGFSF